jgi:hypothetical protein
MRMIRLALVHLYLMISQQPAMLLLVVLLAVPIAYLRYNQGKVVNQLYNFLLRRLIRRKVA